MKRPPHRLILIVVLALLASAAPSEAQELAAVDFGLTQIDLRPVTTYERAVVTIAVPGGRVLRQEFEAGNTISIGLQDRQGNRLPDGVYTYELHLAPKVDDATRRELVAARESGDDGAVARLQREGRLPSGRMSQSGSFSIRDGVLVSPQLSEAPRPAGRSAADGPTLATRTTFTDSLCVGFDCPASPSFSDSSILMMENNTRIKFDDTSVSPFPLNDWEIQANSPSSGGQSYLGFNDCGSSNAGGCADDLLFAVEAGAPANSLYVDSTGRIGFRTATPVLDLHVSTSNTPALRLEQNASGGFTAQTWDVAGNEANFFVRDVTSGSRLPLRIRPGAPSSSVDISADGDVGFGTAAPDAAIDVRRSGVAANLQVTTFSDTLRTDFITRRARGTSGVPAAVQDNDVFGGILMAGHNGTAFANAVSIDGRAEQNWSAAAQGSRLVFQTIPNNSTALTTRMVIRQDGRVGIGTTAPTERLEVSGGNIRVSGGSFIDDGITLNVPDYVFEPGYELRSIEQLADFVEENKHLPGVPSRADVKKNGLNLSQFQMNLLEKVEELALYTIQQNKLIAELEARLAALEAEKQAAAK